MYFETILLFKIVQISKNKAFEVDTNHQSLRARVVGFAPEAFKVLIEEIVV